MSRGKMFVNEYFVNHFDKHNQIPTSEATVALTVSILILLIGILFTTKVKPKNFICQEDHFRIESSTALRGIAIICLLYGHFAEKCIVGEYFFESAGRWAVIIFLFISGIGLIKKYSWSNLPTDFLYRRIAKLLPSVFAATTLVLILDYAFLEKTYSPIILILGCLGIFSTQSPDGPAWFITYIIFLYTVYFLLSKIHIPTTRKIFILFALCYGVSFGIWHIGKRAQYIEEWAQYAFVFPAAVAIGIYLPQIFDFLIKIFIKHKARYLLAMFFIGYLYLNKTGQDVISNCINSYTFSQTIQMVYDLMLVFITVMVTTIFDYYNFESSFLTILGNYSFEIFLIHLPFMENYDFLLFRKP
ncbi:MAG: acyltransferase, partial [Desulfobulbaceae bacterium]